MNLIVIVLPISDHSAKQLHRFFCASSSTKTPSTAKYSFRASHNWLISHFRDYKMIVIHISKVVCIEGSTPTLNGTSRQLWEGEGESTVAVHKCPISISFGSGSSGSVSVRTFICDENL